MDSELIKIRMMRPESYPHPTDQIQLRETHISWVFLTGEFAYKVKKPVDFGFVDFTTLQDRRRFCFEELRRNQRYCEGIYLDVVPIGVSDGKLQVGATECVVEYAVKMRQFDDSLLANRLAVTGQLLAQEVSQLATHIAHCHHLAKRAIENPAAVADRIAGEALENFRVLRELKKDAACTHRLDRIENWTIDVLKKYRKDFENRCKNGFVRECHGDLHLGNLVRWQGQLTPFDAIEFNPDFFWIDVISEIAFVIMDLHDHGAEQLGWRFLNAYLESTGDYQGLGLLRFYLVYRAMIREKVRGLRLMQSGERDEDSGPRGPEAKSYLEMAVQYIKPDSLVLIITHGLSGSGKTHGSQVLLEQVGAIRIRSDVERKRFITEEQSAASASETAEGSLYTVDSREKIYQFLADKAKMILQTGFPVIVDATFLKRKQRDMFRRIAEQLQIPFRIANFDADESTLRHRIRTRSELGNDVSDADERVLEIQWTQLEPLDLEEQKDRIIVK
jgi:aminoglycoside phosphotransferase family enzyme/predicted kinase